MDPWKLAQEKVKKALSLEVRKDFLFKAFADTYAAGGKNIIQDQLSDFWALDQGRFYSLEVKSCHQTKFYFKDVRPSQFIAARRVPAAGGFSRFIIAKCPEWDWYVADGQLFWQLKEAGENGITWDKLNPIKLCWEAIK